MNNNATIWLEDARNGTSLQELIERFSWEVEKDMGYLPMWLTYADRWADIKQLQKHKNPLIAKRAKTEWFWHNELARSQALDDQRKTAYTGILKEISRLLDKVWWIADIHYPHESNNVPESNCCITGDGMGLAYFIFDGDQSDTIVQVVKVVDPKLVSVFEPRGIYQGGTTTLSELRDALLSFRFRENRKCGLE